MNELEVNSYICAAEEVLNDDPAFQSYFNALVEERKALAEKECDERRPPFVRQVRQQRASEIVCGGKPDPAPV